MRPDGKSRLLRSRVLTKARFILATIYLAQGVFLGSSPMLALDPSSANTQYGLRTWTSEDGLPENFVMAGAQTPDGYLWFGTEEGLARFDGVRFTTFFDRKNISTLLVSRDGSLWIAVEESLVQYKDKRMTTYSRENGFSGGEISSLSEGPDNSIWITTRSGLYRHSQGKFTASILTPGSAKDWIWSTCFTRDGALWYGTNGSGLKRLDHGTLTTFTTREGLAGDIVTAILEDSKGDLWIGTNEGLSRIHDGTMTTFPVAGGLSDRNVRAIEEDRDGNIWIGTNEGLNRYSGGKFTSFGSSHRLSHLSILSLLEDREGSLWVGTSGEGFTQLRSGKFISVGQSEGLNDEMVWSVRESRDGSLLIGTNHGFSRLKNGAVTNLTLRDGLSSDSVRALLEDSAGGIWLGTNDGINRLQNGTLSIYRTPEGVPNNTVRVAAEDRSGNIWIGTRGGGLARYRAGAFHVFKTANGLPSNDITSIQEAGDGGLWIGTNGGVSVFQNGVFTNYTVQNGLSNDSVRAIYHDRQGGSWIGTDGGGLNRIKDGRISTISLKDGLFDEVVYAVVEDRRGYLWMSCNRGIFRVSLAKLNDFADGKIKSVQSMAFDATDGMEATECNAGAPSAWEGRDGRLFFATIKGVAIIDPNRMAFNTLAPPVWNEEVLVDGKVEDISSTALTVKPGQRSLEIHYTALSFIEPRKMRFRYRLRGFSENWVEAGNRRTAFFTNLPPGNYTFEVMGSNNDGVWSTVGNPLGFHFRAAFFQTVWFKIACALFLLLVARAAFKIRLRYLRDRERLLVKRVADQTAELSAGKAAAEAIAEINTHLRLKNELILNSIADGVFGVDLSGNVTAENPAAARMLGWESFELIGRPIHDMVHHSTLAGPYPKDKCPMQATLEDGILRQVGDEVFWRKDGTSFPVHYLAAPILDSKGRLTGAAITFRDITEQKAVERMKNEFVSTVSHELRTPLTSIRGALGLLSSGMLGTFAEKGHRMLQIAMANTDRLVRLINDILDLERIDSGKIELNRLDVEVGTLMTQAIEGVQSMADEAGITLASEPVRAILWIDSDRIIQTLTNLLSNAIKFSGRGTTVTVSGFWVDGESLFTFRVADQGRGVPVDKIETIFERFKQVDASDSRDKGGSGLGLAICRSLVAAHQGRIWAEKNDPVGTVFQFTIPAAIAQASEEVLHAA